MASSREYRKLSVECARLARAAPNREAGDSFAAAAKSWLILDRLARAGPKNIAERAGRAIPYGINRKFASAATSIALGRISDVSGPAVRGGGHA
jgi:hypothetical protein